MSKQTYLLAIDPGTNTGWALHDGRDVVVSGVWRLKESRFEGGGMRFVRLRAHLNEIHRTYPVSRVAFEEVRNHKGVDASHIYGGVTATLQTFCEDNGIPYEAIPVGTVKRHATGKGNANKEKMMDAATRKWGAPFHDDNEADARWIAETAVAVTPLNNAA